VQPVPDSSSLPVLQPPPTGAAAAAAQLAGQCLPRTAGLQHEHDADKRRSVGDTRPATLRLGRLRRQERCDEVPQAIREERSAHPPSGPGPVLKRALSVRPERRASGRMGWPRQRRWAVRLRHRIGPRSSRQHIRRRSRQQPRSEIPTALASPSRGVDAERRYPLRRCVVARVVAADSASAGLRMAAAAGTGQCGVVEPATAFQSAARLAGCVARPEGCCAAGVGLRAIG
jgi:hypothetical protein